MAGCEGDVAAGGGEDAFLFLYYLPNCLLIATAACFVFRCLSEAVV